MKSLRLSSFSTLLTIALLASAAGCAPETTTEVAATAVDEEAARAAAVYATPVENPPADRYFGEDGRTRVALVKMPYSGGRNVAELSGGPDYLEQGGLLDLLEGMDVDLRETTTVALTSEQDDDYGEWHRMGMASGNYGELVADNERNGYLTVGLLSNCTSLLGTLAGLQHSGATDQPRKIALMFIDAHGDFNVPETTLSGMLGGMPVAVSAGLCLRNLRLETGLDPALPTENILFGALRDVDPLERELIDNSDATEVSTEDYREISGHLRAEMQRLSDIADLIYIHVDMDVLDPAEVPGHSLNVAGGPTSEELGAALTEIFKFPKVAALGIASTPYGPRDPDGLSLKAAYNLIEGAVKGVQQRQN